MSEISDASGADDLRSPGLPEPAAPELDDLRHPLAQELLFNPTAWAVWPAVALLRWLLRSRQGMDRGMIYRSHPALAFSASEIHDVVLRSNGVEIVLTAPGLASHGSALPMVDIARIVADTNAPGGGALSKWLDGPLDGFMQVLEAARIRHNGSFALASGLPETEAHRWVAEIAGSSAPLARDRGGRLANSFRRRPDGALGLASPFVGTPSAAGLAAAVAGYSGLPTHVDEFTGASVRIQRPVRMGGPLLRMLGRRCDLPAAGVDVVVDGGDRPEGATLAERQVRRAALRDLCAAYIGSPSIQARLFVELEPEVIEPAQLGRAELGGLAVLGRPASRLRIPLAA